MKRHFIYLATGLLVTILFFVMSLSSSHNVFELLFFNQGLNDNLYNLGSYPALATIIIALTWGGAALYYYVINSVRFDRWWHWLSVGAIVTLAAPLACHAYVEAMLSDAGLAYGGTTIQFGMQHVLWTALLFVVASFAMRWWSTNCRHTPFPQ